MNSLIRLASIFLLLLFISISCKKNVNDDVPANPVPTVDLTTKVNASVTGFVTDQNNQPVYGASVKAGAITTTTDKYGYFEVKNTMMVKLAATVTVEYAGYFKGIKTFSAEDGKAVFFRIKLLSKTMAGNIQATTGGTISLPNGLSILFPANAIKNATTGATYSGSVNVAAQWIDPTSTELYKIMPGDLRGINMDGALKGLETYGMAAVELRGAGAELLQIADGKKATMSFPLPAVLSATAPAAIPLWYFDESNGLWKQEGEATKTAGKYVGEVSHFSYWNCDFPGTRIPFTCTIVDYENNPISNVIVKISYQSSITPLIHGSTNSLGYAAGDVPANAQLKLELFSDDNCNAVYSMNFNTGSTSYSAGTIVIPNTVANLALVSGTITTCSGAPAAYGYIIVKNDNQYTRYNFANGQYQFSTFMCNNPTDITLFAVDLASMLQTDIIVRYLVPGVNIIPTIQSCGPLAAKYDGLFELKGIHNRPLYQFPYTTIVEMITVDSSHVVFYWPEVGGVGHPIAIDANNTLSWYGPTIAPAIEFNLTTHEITDVYNTDPTGPPMSMYTGTVPTHNHYDAVTHKIYVAWEYNNNPDRAFFDTLTYLGPR